ncbi:MAG: terminase TerL endonuclease subunit, partial [Pseudomonadota bacterium]
SLVRRLHFCQWTDSEESWISREAWLAVEGDHKLEDFLGRECYAGLDLSYTIDLTALALVFPDGEDPDGNPRYVLFIWFWKPKEGLAEAEKRDKVPYPLWLKEGELEVTQGKVIKLGPIAERLAWIKRKFDLRSVAYDPYRHKELDEELEDLGHFYVPLVAHPQGFRYIPNSELWMPTSVQEFENAIIEQRIAVPVNKLLRYNVAQTVVREDPETNKIFDKKKSRARIDGAVASAMAVGAAKERVRAVFDDVPVDELLVD